MQVRIRLSGFLRQVGLPGGFAGGLLDMPEGASVAAALAQVGVGAKTPWLVTHNGQLAKLDAVLHDGDTLVIIPPISGGNSGKELELVCRVFYGLKS